MYIFLLSFLILGAGLKYIDDAFDEKTFNKKIALMLAPFIGVLWAYIMVINSVAATILLAVILGVLIKGKIDNSAHILGLAVISLILVLFGIQLLFLPLVMLVAAALLDEVGSDVVEYNRESFDKSRFSHKVFIVFFDQRWLTKIAILFLVLVGLFPWYFFFAMLFFDAAYIVMRMYSRLQLRVRDVVVGV